MGKQMIDINDLILDRIISVRLKYLKQFNCEKINA